MNVMERVLKTLNHEEPDKVPMFEFGINNNIIRKHYGFPPDDAQLGLKALKGLPIEVQNQILKEKIFKSSKEFFKMGYRDTYEFYRRAGADIVWSTTTLYPREILKFNDDKEGVGFLDEFGRIMRFEKYQSGEFILSYLGGHFKSFEDYESWEQPDPAWDARLDSFLAGKEVQEEMKNKVFSIPNVAGLMEHAWEGFGFQLFSRILSKPKQARRIFDDGGKFCLDLIKIFAEHDSKLILFADDYGFKNGLMMSPNNYRTYIFPWLKKICNTAHERDCKVILHSDGDLSLIIDDLIGSDIDGLHPIEPTTANPDYDIFKLKEKYRDKIAFAGNLSPNLLTVGTISEIEAYAKRLIRELAPGGGYIFSSGHSTTPQVTLERWLTMQNIKQKFGTYPIKVPD